MSSWVFVALLAVIAILLILLMSKTRKLYDQQVENTVLATERHDIMDEGSCIGIIIKAMQEMYAELQELRRKS